MIKLVPAGEKVIGESKHKLLARVHCDETKYYIKNGVDESMPLFTQVNKPEAPWLVIKYLTEGGRKENLNNSMSSNSKYGKTVGGYKIIPGDVIKLGRIKLKVVEIKVDNLLDDSVDNHTKHFATKYNEKSNLECDINFNQKLNNEINHLPRKSKVKSVCRICYCDESEMDSPLIQPCSCAGTMKHIHLSCLQKWIKSKVDIRTTTSDNCICYSLKQVECELCKSLLPGKKIK